MADQEDESGRRRMLNVLTGPGSVTFGGAPIAPAAVFVPALVKTETSGGARWVKTITAADRS